MPSHHKRTYGDEYGPFRRLGYVNYVNTGHLQRGAGFGGILKGWVKRAIPIIKTKAIMAAKSIGKDLAVQTLDSAYEIGKDILINKRKPMDAIYDQGKKEFDYFKNKITNPFQSTQSQPKKAIKRKASPTPLSLNRNVKRKRPRKNTSKVKRNTPGFRKVTL